MNKLYARLIKMGVTDLKTAERLMEIYKKTGKLPKLPL
jgi:hypothetical protein